LLLCVLAAAYHPAAAQAVRGQKGVVCTSYDQCTDVEIGYFVFPNPAKEVLHIDLTSRDETNLILDLYDISGHPLGGFEQRATVVGRASLQMRMANLPSGTYFLYIMDRTRQTLEIIKFQKK